MVNVGVIGVGYIGMIHVETLMRIPGVQVKAIAESNNDLLKKVSEKYSIDTIATDYREIFQDSDIEVVHNCTPNHMHFAVNKVIIEAGKHIFSEKPLSTTAEEARILRDMVVEKDLLNGIDFCYRYYPTVQEIATKVRKGEIGQVREVLGHYLQDWLLFDTDYSWRLDKKVAGASNTVADLGCHWFDLAQFLSGAKITEVMADLKTFIPTRKKPKGAILSFEKQGAGEMKYEDVAIDVEDYASVLLHFDNGARGVFSTSQLCAGQKCNIDIQLYGSESALAWNHERSAELWQGYRDKACEVLRENPLLQDGQTARFARLPSGHPMGYFDTLYNLFHDFYTILDMKKQNRQSDIQVPDFEIGYNQMQIVEAALRSSQEKRWIEIGS